MKPSEAIQISIDTAKSIQKLRDDALKLVNSDLWKSVIDDAYFTEEASRLVQARMEPLNPNQLDNLDRMLYGIGGLKQFIKDVIRRGTDIDNGIAEMEKEQQAALEEEASL